MTTDAGTTPEQIEATAQHWVVRLSSREIDEAGLHAFQVWVAGSEPRRVAFERARVAWLRLNEVESLRPARDATRGARLSRRSLALAAGIASLAAGIALFLDPVTRMQADAMTSVGVVRSLPLPDGSIAVLDTGSAIAIDYREGERRVRVLRGGAWFDVKSNPQAPFVVQASDVQAVAKGTSYGVSLLADGAKVEVTKGRVEVRSRDGISTLEAGDELMTSAGAALRGALPDNALAWRNGRIQIENATLAEAIAEIDRYRPGRVFVLGALPQTRVNLSLAVTEPDRGLTSLAQSQSLKRVDITRWLTVLTPR
jgi:transmembrane sensor